MSAIKVQPKTPADQAWVDDVLARHWGPGSLIAVHGQIFDARALPALIAGDRQGLLTYTIEPDGRSAELVALNALVPQHGVGTALIEALVSELTAKSIPRLCLTTTNVNLDALGFYQRRGFRIAGLRLGAVDAACKLKPSIPQIGSYGIPLRDELDLVRVMIA